MTTTKKINSKERYIVVGIGIVTVILTFFLIYMAIPLPLWWRASGIISKAPEAADQLYLALNNYQISDNPKVGLSLQGACYDGYEYTAKDGSTLKVDLKFRFRGKAFTDNDVCYFIKEFLGPHDSIGNDLRNSFVDEFGDPYGIIIYNDIDHFLSSSNYAEPENAKSNSADLDNIEPNHAKPNNVEPYNYTNSDNIFRVIKQAKCKTDSGQDLSDSEQNSSDSQGDLPNSQQDLPALKIEKSANTKDFVIYYYAENLNKGVCLSNA